MPNTTDRYDEQLRIIDPITGEPVPNFDYEITLADGSEHHGKTDSGGVTNRIQTASPHFV
jgi:uncharacterized protein (DUF2345 family)